MAAYEPGNKLNKDLPLFNGSNRKLTPKGSNRPGLRSGSAQGTSSRTLARQTDGFPSSLSLDPEPKRPRLRLDSSIEIKPIEELKADVWLCCLGDSTDFLIAKRMGKEGTELEPYLKLADFQEASYHTVTENGN